MCILASQQSTQPRIFKDNWPQIPACKVTALFATGSQDFAVPCLLAFSLLPLSENLGVGLYLCICPHSSLVAPYHIFLSLSMETLGLPPFLLVQLTRSLCYLHGSYYIGFVIITMWDGPVIIGIGEKLSYLQLPGKNSG